MAEPVLVQLHSGLNVPESGTVRGNVVSEHKASVREPAELNLEVHQRYANALEQRVEDIIDPLRDAVYLIQLRTGGEAEGNGVVVIDYRVA